MSRALALAVALASCQPAPAVQDGPPAQTPTDGERTAPTAQAPASLPAPGRRFAPAQVTWDYLADVWDTTLRSVRGSEVRLADHEGKAVLIVNTASKCGYTKQYAALEALQKKYGERGFTVIGFPSNQFYQELGSSEEIADFCSSTYGLTFPLTEPVVVNGRASHPIYARLTPIKDPFGYQGDIRWNFEKFIISADGTEITRFPPRIPPDHPVVIAAIEAALPKPN